MPNILSNSVSGLLAFQRSLAVTSHNISNANTEGYSRQRADLTSRIPQSFGNGYFGRGVQVAGVSRFHDDFLSLQLQNATSESQRLSTFHSFASRVDNLLADSQSGLAPSLQGFFNSVQDVANDPASIPARQVMLSEAEGLAERFQYLDGQLETMDLEVNGRLQGMVTSVNSLSANIADLNDSIVIAFGQSGGHPPNDLLDQRDQMINELAELVSVDVVPQEDHSLNVFIGNGERLVVGNQAQILKVTPDPDEPTQLQVGYDAGAATVIISDQLNGGEIGGTLDFRREVLNSARNELGRIAMVFADTVNAQQGQGTDLNGSLGVDLFSVSSPQVTVNSYNTGAAAVTASIQDSTALTASDYRLSYDGASYSLTRLSDNVSVSGAGPLTMDGFQVDITGAAASGDSFLINPVRKGAQDISVAIHDPAQIAAAAPIVGGVVTSNTGNGVIGPAEVIDISDPDLLDDVEIRFNNPSTDFDVVNLSDGTTVASGVAYTSGDNIEFNGWRVAISETPAAGDSFTLRRNADGVADNRNALQLAGLQTETLVGGSASYEEGYGALIGQVGTVTRQAEISNTAQAGILQQAQQARDSVSGVNLDEEAINLMRYQQAYQASAQVIATAESLFQTLLGAIQR